MYQEETYWKQRAKLFWFAGGENTKFFHSSASARKKSNHIPYLLDDSNYHVDDTDGMYSIVHNYFNELYTGDTTENETSHMISPRKITEDQNSMLIQELKFEEFLEVIKKMHPDKVSGPDGLNPAFFQTFWTMMGHKMLDY